jgi:uncharacterized membrane protein YdbT with pleckstrin-like domain
MKTLEFKPNPRYLFKERLIFTLIALAIAAFGIFMGYLIGRDEGPRVGSIVTQVFLLADLCFWLTAMVLTGFYYRSLRYEIQDDEVIVQVGIVTKSVKHVPFRTVTNIKIKRGILDRFVFNIGTLNIQTAGMSGSTGAEESLVGLENVQELYEIVAKRLRLFRGGMSPTAAESDEVPAGPAEQTLGAILEELKAIRQSLEKK